MQLSHSKTFTWDKVKLTVNNMIYRTQTDPDTGHYGNHCWGILQFFDVQFNIIKGIKPV
jgi:hypothetical protein